MFEMRRHSNDEGYRRSSPRLMHMVSEHGQRVVNSQLLQPTHIQAKPAQPSQMHHVNQKQQGNQQQNLNQLQQPNHQHLSYKRDTPSPRWGGSSGGSLEEQGSPPLKIKHPTPWRHSISGGADQAEVGRQSPQYRQSSPVRMQRSQLRDQESSPPSSRLVKRVETARTWEDLNSYYNKLSKTRKIGSSSWESLDDKEVKSSPELKINELTVGYLDGVDCRQTDCRSKTPDSRRKGSSSKELSPSLSRKEFANQLGVIGENRIVKRDSLSSPLFRSPSSVGQDDDRRHSPPTHDFTNQLRDPVGPPRQSSFNTSPIDVAAMEADCNDGEDDNQGTGVTPSVAPSKASNEMSAASLVQFVYCMACLHQIVGLDALAQLALLLAVLSVVLFILL
ncbi:Hypothetical protein NTJ_15733 [Nesidiocoris tenuis]|uniref:Uncharacterized protein n=1 Tax=Nesidiocoris tenuis TaxID=355587 RepID=A0ABN7BGS2_9HEMI|nr:Hypothetical protein NTJ_15733 [Nesidiocoris tenuis]